MKFTIQSSDTKIQVSYEWCHDIEWLNLTKEDDLALTEGRAWSASIRASIGDIEITSITDIVHCDHMDNELELEKRITECLLVSLAKGALRKKMGHNGIITHI